MIQVKNYDTVYEKFQPIHNTASNSSATNWFTQSQHPKSSILELYASTTSILYSQPIYPDLNLFSVIIIPQPTYYEVSNIRLILNTQYHQLIFRTHFIIHIQTTTEIYRIGTTLRENRTLRHTKYLYY